MVGVLLKRTGDPEKQASGGPPSKAAEHRFPSEVKFWRNNSGCFVARLWRLVEFFITCSSSSLSEGLIWNDKLLIIH